MFICCLIYVCVVCPACWFPSVSQEFGSNTIRVFSKRSVKRVWSFVIIAAALVKTLVKNRRSRFSQVTLLPPSVLSFLTL